MMSTLERRLAFAMKAKAVDGSYQGLADDEFCAAGAVTYSTDPSEVQTKAPARLTASA